MDISILVSFVAGAVLFGILGYLIAYRAFKNSIEQKARKLLAGKQEAFIAIASHYLLTPISVIQSAVTRLNEKPTLELSERQKLYGTIVSGEKRLYIIAEQMLLAVKLINGQLDVSPKVGHINDPVVEAIKETEAIAQQKNVTIKVDMPQNPPIEASFDAKQLRIAIVALIDNAIKFSHEKGSIMLTVRSEKAGVVIEVKDNGIGMTAEQQARATEKFYRGTPPYVFDYEGMGLGLHVAYVIMHAHGGDIEVSSKGKNRGAINRLILPLN